MNLPIGGVLEDRAVCLILAAKQVTESCASVGDALAIKEIKPSGTLGYRFVKRLFDLVFSLLMSALLLIPIAILCALISLESPGSPMYTQERVGKGGRTIKIFKLRSMVADAGDVQKYLSPEQLHQWEVERKVDDDPRITKIGQFIRKCSIDEMPQFLNVLNGDLSSLVLAPSQEMSLNSIFRMKKWLSCSQFGLELLAFGRQQTEMRRLLKAGCGKRLNFGTFRIGAFVWISIVSATPSGQCLVKIGRGDRCKHPIHVLTAC